MNNKLKITSDFQGKNQGKKRKVHNKRIKLANDKKLIKAANDLENPLKLLKSCTYERNGHVFFCECKRSFSLDVLVWEWIFQLEVKNMKTMYEDSKWGWNFDKKKTEMTHLMAWYLIVKTTNGENVGFSHFRFDLDYGRPVLYCYELQLEESVFRLGIGSFIMNVLENLAFSCKMEKVVLTAFNHNDSALKFYSHLNYTKDITSPDDDDEETFCYVILSKNFDSLNNGLSKIL